LRFGQREIEKSLRLSGSTERDQGFDLSRIDEQGLLDVRVLAGDAERVIEELERALVLLPLQQPVPGEGFVPDERADIIQLARFLHRADHTRYSGREISREIRDDG